MSFFKVQFRSDILSGEGEFGVFLPRNAQPPYKVLWLLHGAFGDFTESIQYTSVLMYAERRGLAVVAPSSYMGVYTDMVYGEKGYSFVKEVLEKAPKLFRCLSEKREDSYLMGISMGGHGTFKLAAEMPERFRGACGFSSPVDMVYTMSILEKGEHFGGHELFDAFGSSAAYSGTVGDVISNLKRDLQEGRQLPRLALCWGDSDHAAPEDERVKEILDQLGVKLYYRVGPGGHEFDTWDPMMQEVLDYLMKEED
jgi:S-formylglutathione hydrolase FrmB